MIRTIRRAMVVLVASALVGACATTPTAAPGAVAPPGTTVGMTTHATLGAYLTDSRGRAVYLWLGDSSAASMCTGACAATWPPLTVSGPPTAGPGVDAAKLGTLARPDGTTQVTYDRHPLYLFVQDKAVGDVKGQGSTGFGAAWWLIRPDGSSITETPPPADGGVPMGGY